MEKNNRWSCTNKFLQKNSNGSFFPIGSSCQQWLIQAFFYWLHEMAACCCFGFDLGKRFDLYYLSRLTDWTPHSSSDLLYFTLLLRFYLDKLFQVQLLFSLLSFWTKIFSSPIPLLSSLAMKNIPSLTSILQKYSKTIPNSVLAAKSFQSRKKLLSPIFFLT